MIQTLHQATDKQSTYGVHTVNHIKLAQTQIIIVTVLLLLAIATINKNLTHLWASMSTGPVIIQHLIVQPHAVITITI